MSREQSGICASRWYHLRSEMEVDESVSDTSFSHLLADLNGAGHGEDGRQGLCRASSSSSSSSTYLPFVCMEIDACKVNESEVARSCRVRCIPCVSPNNSAT